MNVCRCGETLDAPIQRVLPAALISRSTSTRLPRSTSSTVALCSCKQIDRLRAQLPEAVVDVPQQVVPGPLVRRFVMVASRHHAAANFRRQGELTTAFAQELTDIRLAKAVVVGSVHKSHPSLEHGVEDTFALRGGHGSPTPDPGAADLHGAVAEARDAQISAAERPRRESRHCFVN